MRNTLLKKQSWIFVIIYAIFMVIIKFHYDYDATNLIWISIVITGIYVLGAIHNAVDVLTNNGTVESIVTVTMVRELLKKGILEINPDADMASINDLYHLIDEGFESLNQVDDQSKKTK